MLVDPPGEMPSGGAEREVFTSADGRFVTGLWSREPDTWSFERPYDEVALILSGSAEVESEDGRLLGLGAGDVMVTPTGSKGTWRIGETITKFYAIYSAGTAGDDTSIRLLGADEPVEWIVLENAPGDENPPGEEWYAYRSSDRRFSTGFWRRAPESGAFVRDYHEIAILLQGDVEVKDKDGVMELEPGDVLVTPAGSRGTWRAKTPVRKFWAVYHE